jgi:C-terminal processing protease CtpA/Prc
VPGKGEFNDQISEIEMDSSYFNFQRLKLDVDPLFLKPMVYTYPGDIHILCDEKTACATEIFMHDHDRVTIVGEKTRGAKQIAIFVAIEDWLFQIPICSYYTKEREMGDGKGIEPDVKVKSASS